MQHLGKVVAQMRAGGYFDRIMELGLELDRVKKFLRACAGVCIDYTWGDFVFSAMNPGVHLPGHCSIDNLRVRVHLGIGIPEKCTLRVGVENRTWEEGKCLVFEDSFEHEVWNRSDSRRIVLIADLWHPDLNDVEVRALTAAFRKSEVRRIFMRERMEMTDSPEKYARFIEAVLESQDDDPFIREFWPG